MKMMPSRGKRKHGNPLTASSTNYSHVTLNSDATSMCLNRDSITSRHKQTADDHQLLSRDSWPPRNGRMIKISQQIRRRMNANLNKNVNVNVNVKCDVIELSSSVDDDNNMQFSRNSSHILVICILFSLMSCTCIEVAANAVGAAALGAPAAISELSSLGGQLGGSVRLPCLIGRQFYCGEPYFIAWYKLNPNRPLGGWSRIEYVTSQSLSSISNKGDEEQQQQRQLASDSYASSTNQSNRFTFFRGHQSSSCDSQFGTSSPVSTSGPAKRLATAQELECAQLEINKLELSDEGQYKCEITFSESLEVDKCPPSSVSRLTVIARPREPELLLNGRLLPATTTTTSPPGPFKEGAQIRLECQSSGGKPAPRVEWLNVTSPSGGHFDSLSEHDVQLIRSQRKSSNGLALISSSSIQISLSRYDLASQFVCLVMPDTSVAPQQLHPVPQSAHFWVRMLQRAASKQHQVAMLKSIKFDIQVKPATVSLVVRDPMRNVSLAPVSWQAEWAASVLGATPQQSQFYSLQLNHLYLLQCVVSGSRPASQVVWFNRTAPLGLGDPVSLADAEFELPESGGHRLSSFVRQIAQGDGTFRTVGSLLLTTNIWDNFEELFCRVSNDAFQFEELTSQVLPILPAGLYVNYAPFARLELDQSGGGGVEFAGPSNETINAVRADEGAQVTLRCLVGANPLAQASILQIEWLKDNQTLDGLPVQFPFAVERANQLHMGASQQAHQNKQFLVQFQQQQAQDSSQLLANSKLLAISTLQLRPVTRASAGAYSCQFKIIPAPHQAVNSNTNNKILSGRCKQSVQVRVAEAKPKAPTLRIQSSAGLLAYKPAELRQLIEGPKNSLNRQLEPVVVASELRSSISLRCEIAQSNQLAVTPATPTTMAGQQATNKISWFANGVHLHSSSTSDTFNVSLASLLVSIKNNDQASFNNHVETSFRDSLELSCSCQVVLAPSAGYSPLTSFHSNQIRQIPSSNQIELRLAVKPELEAARPDLMPPVRGFSELELDSKPADKLKLACMARCEPLCSLNWFINLNQLLPKSQLEQSSESRPKTTLSDDSVVLGRFEDLAFGSELGFGLTLQEVVSAERQVNGSGWVYEARIAEKSALISSSEPGALKRELGDSKSSTPNVFSSLELSYNHIKSLLVKNEDDLVIKCAISEQTSLHNSWAFKYEVIAPNTWFPSSNNNGQDANNYHQFNTKTANDGLTKSSQRQLQTRISIDRPPRNVKLVFDSLLGPEVSPFGLSIAENQLIEFSDPNKPRPILRCLVSGSPATKFKWIFTHLNGTEELLYVEGNELDFRQTIELRQRQSQANPSSAYGYDVVSSLSGNYTCIASNEHGFSSASLPVQIHGRPLCKLTLDGERLNPDDKSLSADLKCSVYSIPQALETVWFRGSRELASNRSDPIDSLMLASDDKSAFKLTIALLNKEQDFLQADLVTSSDINYKCLVKNSLGYSEICELSSSHRQLIVNILKRDLNLQAADPALSSIASNRQQATSSMMWPPANWPIFSQANGDLQSIVSSNQQVQHQQQQLSHLKSISTMSVRYDLVALGVICCILSIYLGVLTLHKIRGLRRFKGGRNNPSNWHFNSSERQRSQQANYGVNGNLNGASNDGSRILHDAHKTMHSSASAIINQRLINANNSKPASSSSTFQSSMIGFGAATAANFYGGSNGDSEHDMIQSCSQSSQYEDLLGANNGSSSTTNNSSIQNNNKAQVNYQSQALYFNHELASSAATMNNRRHNNSSHFFGKSIHHPSATAAAATTTKTTITANEMHPNTQLVRLEFDNNTSRLCSRFQASGNNKNRKLANPNEPIFGNGRVPLIDGSQTSRIKLDDERSNNYATTTTTHSNGIHLQRIEAHPGPDVLQQEHIYDDVIYKKNLL